MDTTRFGLKNWRKPISYKDFQTLSLEFKNAVEHPFDTECQMDIVLMRRLKTYTTSLETKIIDDVKDMNNFYTFKTTNVLEDISSDDWEKTVYAEVNIKPIDETKAPKAASATAMFKGRNKKLANFLLLPEDKYVRQKMFSENRFKRHTNGLEEQGSEWKPT